MEPYGAADPPLFDVDIDDIRVHTEALPPSALGYWTTGSARARRCSEAPDDFFDPTADEKNLSCSTIVPSPFDGEGNLPIPILLSRMIR